MPKPSRPIERRDFLTTLLLVPIGARLAGCGSSDNSYGEGEAEGGGDCAVEPTSTSVNGHTHTVCVLQSDLDDPPAAGATYATSSSGHTHTVALSQAELTSIAAGDSVMVDTSNNGHQHSFTIMLA